MNARARRERNRLERIAAFLLALAGLAEHAATRSAPVRLVVLWILRRAEAVAMDFVAGEAAMAGFQIDLPPQGSGHTPEDALALAFSLRLMAFAVQALLAGAARLPDEAAISCLLKRLARLVPHLGHATLAPVGPIDSS